MSIGYLEFSVKSGWPGAWVRSGEGRLGLSGNSTEQADSDYNNVRHHLAMGVRHSNLQALTLDQVFFSGA